MQVLYIMQGAPGSGKSFVACGIKSAIFYQAPESNLNMFSEYAQIASTDDFFLVLEPDGERLLHYVFNKEKIGEAHKWNQDRVREWLSKGYSVIVDNTNIKAWQARPYVEMAVALGIPVIFVRVDGRFQNTHGVPEEVVQKMREGMEELTVEKCLAAEYPWETPPEVQEVPS